MESCCNRRIYPGLQSGKDLLISYTFAYTYNIQGGKVNANFVINYNAAKAAGIPRIDAYLFPCTGTQSNGVACKTPATQIDEFLAAVDDNNMDIVHYWIDFEPTPGGECNAWNLSKAANAALAREWVSLLQASGRPWGIYAIP